MRRRKPLERKGKRTKRPPKERDDDDELEPAEEASLEERRDMEEIYELARDIVSEYGDHGIKGVIALRMAAEAIQKATRSEGRARVLRGRGD